MDNRILVPDTFGQTCIWYIKWKIIYLYLVHSNIFVSYIFKRPRHTTSSTARHDSTYSVYAIVVSCLMPVSPRPPWI